MRYSTGFFPKHTILLLMFSALLSAQWSTSSTVNNAICTSTNHQQYPTIVSDGAGGSFITWHDTRNGNQDIYAQRINASGVVQWTADGVAISIATGTQQYPTIVSDNSGGAIITWFDGRSGGQDIYAQRINASGAVQWDSNGVALCSATGDQRYPTIVSDNAGGAIITWYDYRGGVTADIYTQRVNASGAVQWTANGVAICTATNAQGDPTIASDGSGGAIITWMDFRGGNNYDIYAQRINGSGATQWSGNGVPISTATHHQQYPKIVSDNSGGAIITWYDGRNGNDDIYTQGINASGAVQWTSNGVAICTATGTQQSPTIVSDNSGGAIITWFDGRSGTNDIYAQRINASGTVQWTANGTALCVATGSQQAPTIVGDGTGGAIITWSDFRSGNFDVYAQHINTSGAVQWDSNGVAICMATAHQQVPTIVSDGAGGAIITWMDLRNGATNDIYVSQISANGNLGTGAFPAEVEFNIGSVPIQIELAQNYPNPFNPTTVISYQIPMSSNVSLKVYDAIGREVAILVNEVKEAGTYSVQFDASKLSRQNTGGLASGIYFYTLKSGNNIQTKKLLLLK